MHVHARTWPENLQPSCSCIPAILPPTAGGWASSLAMTAGPALMRQPGSSLLAAWPVELGQCCGCGCYSAAVAADLLHET